jgi:hypothetical protein
MPAQAPRVDPRIVAALRKLDDRSLPIAETCRRAGVLAERLGVARPSYEQIRVLVHRERRRAMARRARLDVALDVYSGKRPPRALLEGRE